MTHPHNLFPKVFQPSASRTFSFSPQLCLCTFSLHVSTQKRHINNKQFPLPQHRKDAQRQHPSNRKVSVCACSRCSNSRWKHFFLWSFCMLHHPPSHQHPPLHQPNPMCLSMHAQIAKNSQTEKSSALLHNWELLFFFSPHMHKSSS